MAASFAPKAKVLAEYKRREGGKLKGEALATRFRASLALTTGFLVVEATPNETQRAAVGASGSTSPGRSVKPKTRGGNHRPPN